MLKQALAAIAVLSSALATPAHSLQISSGPAESLSTLFSEWASDTFDGFTIAPGVTSVARTTGMFSYTASASSGLFAVGEDAQRALSISSSGDTLTLSGFGSDVRIVAAHFYATDFDGTAVPGDFTFTVTESAAFAPFPYTVTFNWSNFANVDRLTGIATPKNFAAFVASPGYSITSVSIAVPSSSVWVTVDNLVLAVPEPQTYALMLLGLATILTARQRRAARG